MELKRGRPRDSAARARIVASAAELFTRQGYLSTTVADVAAAAGVAVQTVYSAYGSKVGVLAATHDVALAGDDEPLALADRPWFAELAEASSASAAWTSALSWMHASTARVASVYAAMLAAESDPAVAELIARMRAQRSTFARLLADQVCARPGGEHVDRDRFADVVYTTETVETYLLLVTQRGWSVEQWQAWVERVVALELTLAPGGER